MDGIQNVPGLIFCKQDRAAHSAAESRKPLNVLPLFCLFSYCCSAAYLHAASAATAPSAAAVVSWRTSLVLQSPAAKIPGWDVIQSSDARIKPDASSLTTSANISFCGICPTAMNTPDTSILKSFPVFLSVRRSPSTAVSPRISHPLRQFLDLCTTQI